MVTVRKSTIASLTAAMTALLCAASATAQSVSLLATGDPDRESFFSLNFTDFGVISEAEISSTVYELEVDEAAGTARFRDYYQQVEPLTLPGDISTGNLQIAVVPGSSQGTYDPATGEFTTEELYAIHFDGDLSAFGLESPVYLPGSSVGTVVFDGQESGTIGMVWDGEGQLDNPGDPGNPLHFVYRCEVNTVFAADDGCARDGCDAGDVNRDCVVDAADLSDLLGNFGTAGPAVLRESGDVDYDGDVDLKDLASVLGAFGVDCN